MELRDCFKKSLSKSVYIYVVSMLNGLPPKVVATVPSDNKLDHEEIASRWQLIVELFKKKGYEVVSVAADGDPKVFNFLSSKEFLI